MVSPAPKTPTTVKTPTAPTFKTPGMSLSPQFGGVLKTPTMPSIGATNKTPVQQTGAVKDKSTLFSLKGQSLNIVPQDFSPYKPNAQHQPSNVVPQNIPTLYHGSPSAFKPGEVIKSGGKYSKDYAYASSDKETAGLYAKDKAGYSGEPSGQLALWGVVNKVEPANPSTTYKDVSKHGKNTAAYVSKEGFISKGPTHLVDPQGTMTPVVGQGKSSTARKDILSPPRTSSFEQGRLDFGNWQPKTHPIV